MTPSPAEFRLIAEHPALVFALAAIEKDAIERMIGCAPADDMNRRTAALEARAVRALRSRLEALGRPATEAAKGPSPYA